MPCESGASDSSVSSHQRAETRPKEIVEDLKSEISDESPHAVLDSGKTIVAFEAIVIAVANGYQAAIMAPTRYSPNSITGMPGGYWLR